MEQCYLYAQFVNEMIEYSAYRYSNGETEKADEMLKSSQKFARRVHALLAGNTKKLKEAPILLRHAAFGRTDVLHAGNYDDRSLVKETSAQVDQTQQDAMLQLFKK